MVTHEHVGTCQHEHVGVMSLAENGLQRMLLPPVEADDDDSCGVLLAEMEHT